MGLTARSSVPWKTQPWGANYHRGPRSQIRADQPREHSWLRRRRGRRGSGHHEYSEGPRSRGTDLLEQPRALRLQGEQLPFVGQLGRVGGRKIRELEQLRRAGLA